MNHHNYNNEPPHHYIQSTWLFLSHAWHGHEHGVTVAMQGIPTGDEVYMLVIFVKRRFAGITILPSSPLDTNSLYLNRKVAVNTLK